MIIRFISFIIISALSLNTSAQFPDTGYCSKRPPINISATLTGFDFSGKVYVSKDSLKAGFKLKLSDPDYSIVGFRVYFFGKYMDLYWKEITGNTATPENLPILKSLRGDEWMEIECINLSKDKSIYIAKPFIIIIPESHPSPQ